MTNQKHLSRQGLTALALVAGLSSSTAFAQPAPAPAAAPAPAPAAPAPAITPPAAPAAAPAVNPAPAPVVVEPPPVAVASVPSPAPVPAAPMSEAPPPKKLEVGSGGGFFQPAALLQFWTYYSHQDMTPTGKTAAVADETTFNFRLRRAELRIKGEVVPKLVAYQVMIDPARALEVNNVKADGVPVAQPPMGVDGKFTPLTILQDYFITFQSDYADVSLGQFKIPVSYEGYYSSSKTLFPERAPASRLYGDKRDIGLRVDKKIGDHFYYSAGLFNGSGQNKVDDDTEKDGALRLEGYIEGLTVAGVGYTTFGKREKSSRDRLEADVKYDAHNIYVLGEYIHGWDTKGGGKAVEGHGTYVEAGYTLFDHLQPMVRVGDVEPAMHKKGDHYWHYEAGLAWLLQKNEAKVTLAGAIYDPTNENPPTNPKRTEVILAAQAGF